MKGENSMVSSLNNSYKSAAFKEEENNLADVENIIENKLFEAQRKENNKQEQVSKMSNDDPASVQDRGTLMSEQRKYEQQYLEYESFINSPYFGRVKVQKGESEIDFFVGEKSFPDNDVNIFCWQNPLASSIYSNERSVKVKDTQYDVLLRRKIEIDNATVNNVTTEFDATVAQRRTNNSSTKDVFDPFLRSVLNRKRQIGRASCRERV